MNNVSMRQRKRNRKKRKRVVTRPMKLSLVIFFCCTVILFSGLMIKILYLNEVKGNSYKKQVLSQQAYVNNSINFRRGAIKDRNDTVLAVSTRVYNLILEPRTLKTNPKNLEPTLAALTQCYGIKREVVEKIISDNPSSMYQKVDALKGLTSEQRDTFEKLSKAKNSKIAGVWFEEDYVRNYPLNTVACDILGFANNDNVGSYGVEENYNGTLNGTKGREYGYFDSDLNLQRTIKSATNGQNVVLTIDANVQKIVEEEIGKFQKDTGAKNIAVMMMNPNTGEILAMASKPVYNLNNPRDLTPMYSQAKIDKMSEKEKMQALMKMWGNFCTSYAYEPGSTFKPFTVSAALDEGVISQNSTFVCDGQEVICGKRIFCSHHSGHGKINTQQALMLSCNDALMQIGAKLKRNGFSKYNAIYGFGKKTGIDLPGEELGIIHSEKQLNPVELATSSFGQTQTVTMVQMLSGFCSLINGGNYYQPHVVKEIQNESGAVTETKDPILVRKTISETTSKFIRESMRQTVLKGTATSAAVPGYEIGGKTGTAEKYPRSKKNYLLSFIGCVPTSNPQIAYYVIVDQPNVSDQAHSTFATELSARIMKKVLPFLGIYSK